MKELRVSDDAKADLLEIWLYISEKNESAADRITEGITAKYELLLEFPEMGRSREALGLGYRSFVVGSYVIYYRLIEEGIEISRVVHGSRDIQNLL